MSLVQGSELNQPAAPFTVLGGPGSNTVQQPGTLGQGASAGSVQVVGDKVAPAQTGFTDLEGAVLVGLVLAVLVLTYLWVRD